MVIFTTGETYRIRVGEDIRPARLVNQSLWYAADDVRWPVGLHNLARPYDKRGYLVLRARDGVGLMADEVVTKMWKIPIPINNPPERVADVMTEFQKLLIGDIMLDLIPSENFVNYW